MKTKNFNNLIKSNGDVRYAKQSECSMCKAHTKFCSAFLCSETPATKFDNRHYLNIKFLLLLQVEFQKLKTNES